MPWGAVAGAVISGVVASDSGRKAANAQKDAANAGIDQQNAQFEEIQKLLQPYVQAGNGALTGQQNLIGLNGADPQRQAIAGLEGSPEFAALMQQGENGILQNASATGGLRGGNTQAALAQFRPAMLAALIEQQYGRLGGLTSVGQNAAAGVGNAGMQNSGQISQLLGQYGSAQAGGALAQGKAMNGMIGGLTGAFGQYLGQQKPSTMPAPQAGQFGNNQFGGQFDGSAFMGGGNGGFLTGGPF